MSNDATTYTTPPPFPNGDYSRHGRAALVMMLQGDEPSQYTYHEETGYPTSDFRTRISEMYRDGWPIHRQFHMTTDHDGQPRRCKKYWLDPDLMEELYQRFPEFRHRCEMLVKESGG